MRKYGQHFLINNTVIDGIVSAVPAGAQNVVEIGPGRGALTGKLLSKKIARFTAVEIDPQMQTYLLEAFPAIKGKIILSDFLKFDLASLPQEPTFFVSNLPYIDAADILDKVLSFAYFDGAVFMFQKEQAQRILALPGAEGYGPLSILSQLRAQPRMLLRVGKACFNPPPKVESAVLTFAPKAYPLDKAQYPRFARLVKAAFAHKRKTLFNSLVLCGYDKTKTEEALAQNGIKPTARAQEIALEKFLQIFSQFNQ